VIEETICSVDEGLSGGGVIACSFVGKLSVPSDRSRVCVEQVPTEVVCGVPRGDSAHLYGLHSLAESGSLVLLANPKFVPALFCLT
jgi:hypothetical protein